MSTERGFALLTVLVILGAVSLLGFVALERAALSSALGVVAARTRALDQRTSALVLDRIASGLDMGFTGLCVEGVCGRTANGVPRVWTSSTVQVSGLEAGEACASVTEYLGEEDGMSFWRVAATCDGALRVADVSVASNGVVAVEWGEP